MKKLVTFAVLATMIAAFAFPVLAQDEVVLTGGDIDSLFGGGNNRNRGNNNNQPQIPDPVYLFEEVKVLLKNNKVPLDKAQEKSLPVFLTTETAAIRTALEAQFTNRGNNGGRGGNNNQTMITDLEAAVTKHNTALLAEIKAALTPDQVSLIAKAEKDSKKICTVMVDLVNFQALAARFQNEQNNFRGRGGGGPGGFEGGGLDIIGLDLGGGGGGGGGNNGFPGNRGGNNISSLLPNRASCTSKDSTSAQRVAVLGDILTKGKKPLTADQMAKFEPMAETHVKAMVEELKVKDQQIDRFVNDLNNQIKNNNQNNQTQAQQPPTVNVQTLTNNVVNTIMQNLGIQTNNNNQNQGNRGGGRGNQNGNQPNQPQNNNQAANNQPPNQNQNQPQNNQNQNFQNFQNNRGNNNNGNFNIQAEVQKKSEELMDKLAATLKPEQAPFIKKMKWDQIKAKGGVDKYRGILESEGTPLTAEQVTQIQNLINAEGQAVRAAAQTLVQKEIQALPEGALQAAAVQYQQEQQRLQQQQQNPQQGRNNNNQQNNVNQNQEAQKIIAKVLPEVSKRHAQLMGATQDAILKVMTPPQQASYKINTMPIK